MAQAIAGSSTNTPELACLGMGGLAILVALVPAAVELPALATLAMLSAALIALIVYEARAFAELRERLRHQLASG